MPDYPHRGPNASRIRLEGAGGFIIALMPVLTLLIGAPLVLVGWVALGAALAPFLYWRNRSPERSLTHLRVGLAGLLFGVLMVLIVGAESRMRLFAVLCVAGGLMGAAIRSRWAGHVRHPSIRDHNQL